MLLCCIGCFFEYLLPPSRHFANDKSHSSFIYHDISFKSTTLLKCHTKCFLAYALRLFLDNRPYYKPYVVSKGAYLAIVVCHDAVSFAQRSLLVLSSQPLV